MGTRTETEKIETFTMIADSSGLVSLVTATDRNHEAAVAAGQRLVRTRSTILVPGDIFTETINVLGKKSGHAVAIRTAKEILDGDAFIVGETNDEIRRDAFGLFQSQPPSVSFADCVVMASANYYGTRDIFGFDAVFSDNGYHALVQPEEVTGD